MTRVASPLLASVVLIAAFAWFLHFGMKVPWSAVADAPIWSIRWWIVRF